MDETGKHQQHDDKGQSGINRRRFLGALGAAAAPGAILETGGARAQNPSIYYFQNSFGEIVPVSQAAINAGIPLPPQASVGQAPPGPDAVRSGKPHRANPDLGGLGGGGCASLHGPQVTADPQPNILLIMVDQMRYPRWLTADQLNSVQMTATPNIYAFSQQSYIFPNYHVVASPCTPSRAAILTGLYPQQTCMFLNQDGDVGQAPALLPYNDSYDPLTYNSHHPSTYPGFPTIGNVLSQSLPNSSGVYSQYNCAWLGKWHLSDPGVGTNDYAGANGPVDYGFSNGYNIPASPTPATSNPYYPAVYPSPSGSLNEGGGGNSLAPFGSASGPTSMSLSNYGSPGFPTGTPYNTGDTFPPPPTPLTNNQLNDTAIAQAFTTAWLANPPAEPWFCALSFINPHDMSRFPWAFGLAGNSIDFQNPPTNPDEFGYFPPSTGGVLDNTCTAPCNALDVKTLPTIYTPTSPPPAGNWNTDDPLLNPYLGCGGEAMGKPGLQAYFEYSFNQDCGTIDTANGWVTFLNYYFWMQQCVDTLFHQVLGYLKEHNPFSNPILVVFTSDHGDFGGSHNLHSKGGALYDECTNVPLYISFLRNDISSPIVSPFVCSSVDLLPFFYSMALGNEGWRCSMPDNMVAYLSGRESIMDAMYAETPQQRRLSNIPNADGPVNGQTTQPYVLHTIDQYSSAPFESNKTCGEGSLTRANQPSHGIGFRTVDLSINPTRQKKSWVDSGSGSLPSE